MRDRTKVAIAVVGALWAATALWGFTQYGARTQLGTLLENRYQQNFNDLINGVENVEIMLGKSLVSGSPKNNVVHLTEVWRQANAAQANLTDLPIAQSLKNRTAKFLSQVADYSFVMAKTNANGELLSESQRETLARLRSEAGDLARQLNEAAPADGGIIRWGRMVTSANDDLEQASRDLPTSFADIDKQMMEYPTLIYDGPFSDSVIERKPRGLGDKEVSQDTARDTARKYLESAGIDVSDVRDSGKISGNIPAYSFEGIIGGTAQANLAPMVEVAVNGGMVTWMLDPRTVSKATISREDAIDRAKRFLADVGYKNVDPTYSSIQGNVAVIPFVDVVDDVRIYPDMVKVQVALDNGDIIGLDAISYIMNHHPRKLPKPKVTEVEARKKASSEFDIESVRLAVIPSYDEKDLLCYELMGKYGPDDYIVYINAESGDEERLLKVVDTPQGQFTM